MTTPAQLTKTLTDIAVHAPFVMATRMASFLWPVSEASQRKEIARMVEEKQAAAVEAYCAWGLACQRAVLQAWGFSPSHPDRDAIRALHEMAKPYQRRVNANTRRLRKAR